MQQKQRRQQPQEKYLNRRNALGLNFSTCPPSPSLPSSSPPPSSGFPPPSFPSPLSASFSMAMDTDLRDLKPMPYLTFFKYKNPFFDLTCPPSASPWPCCRSRSTSCSRTLTLTPAPASRPRGTRSIGRTRRWRTQQAKGENEKKS